jgi:hypothetical protein
VERSSILRNSRRSARKYKDSRIVIVHGWNSDLTASQIMVVNVAAAGFALVRRQPEHATRQPAYGRRRLPGSASGFSPPPSANAWNS